MTQGFLTHAVKIYQEMLDADPDNADLRKRVDELSLAVAAEAADGIDVPEGDAPGTEEPVTSAAVANCPAGTDLPAAISDDRVIQTLEQWLDTIRRRR